ncbi:MAG: phosphate acyltransferase, partial [Desulfarculus sp.]|nr:phosphate--acyl-ACP acyltransferase [Pseudomonadota bacterium]MBV1751528.1 phosphate acyltransferase [Desulfarculus sp.]
MRIALDGMGGDNAPEAVVKGALQALTETPPDVEIILVGQPEVLEPLLEQENVSSPRLSLHPAAQVVAMDESPGVALRRMPGSSIRVCYDLHKSGEADAVVSAGNSGAT